MSYRPWWTWLGIIGSRKHYLYSIMYSYLRGYMDNGRWRDAFIVIWFIILSYVPMGINVPWSLSCILRFKFPFAMLCVASNVGLDMIYFYQERMFYVWYGFFSLKGWSTWANSCIKLLLCSMGLCFIGQEGHKPNVYFTMLSEIKII